MIPIFNRLLIASSLFLTSCGTLNSSFHYSKGTEYYDKGDYQAAVVELERAVELGPSMARNHSNLASAYQILGREHEAWFHIRQAVLCEYPDTVGSINFTNFCEHLIKQPGLNQPGTALEEVINKLGIPDIIMGTDRDNKTICIYGTCTMVFQDLNLTSCSFK